MILLRHKAGETAEEVVPEAVGIDQLTAGYLKLFSLIFIHILLHSGQTELTSATTASKKHSTTVAKSRIQRQAFDNFIFTVCALATRGFSAPLIRKFKLVCWVCAFHCLRYFIFSFQMYYFDKSENLLGRGLVNCPTR